MLRRKWKIVCSSFCDRGDIRESNQDALLVRYEDIRGMPAGLFAVADGCGGLMHGDKISQLLTARCEDFWKKKFPDLISYPSPESVRKAVLGWLDDVNREAKAYGDELGSRVGSTMSMLLLIGRQYFIFNVGDSRVYRCRKGTSLCLTEDQSLLADKLRNNEISPEEAKRFKGKNVLTMCVGYYDKVQVFTTCGTMRRGDVFLLCSDGFYNGVGHLSLESIIPDFVAEESASLMRSRIPDGAARDNISVIVFQVR